MSYKNKLITAQEAKEMYDNYTNGNYKLINDHRDPSQPDSRSYWFSFEDLLGYIDHLKREGLTGQGMGLRIFMGAYGDNVRLEGEEVGGYQNVFLSPTKQDETSFSERSESLMNKGILSPPN